jgi:hypothetical protein
VRPGHSGVIQLLPELLDVTDVDRGRLGVQRVREHQSAKTDDRAQLSPQAANCTRLLRHRGVGTPARIVATDGP